MIPFKIILKIGLSKKFFNNRVTKSLKPSYLNVNRKFQIKFWSVLCILLTLFVLQSDLHSFGVERLSLSHFQTNSEFPLEELQKNFDLSANDFQIMLENLMNGDQTLFKQIFLSQVGESIRFLQIKFQSNYEDAYDVVLDTLLAYRQRLVDGKITYGNLRFLFLQMASQEYLRSKKKSVYSSESDLISGLPEMNDEDVEAYPEDQVQILEKAMALISESCRELLKMNYFFGMKLNDIAAKLEKSPKSVRKQKERCKESLVTQFNSMME